jgi:hypothetical protein
MNRCDSNGMKDRDSTRETSRLTAMVRERDLKKAPVTPVRKTSGAKTTIVLSEDPRIGGKISVTETWTASDAAVFLRARWRMMFSTTTMASSMMSPMAAAIPPRVMMLKLRPKPRMIRIAMAMTRGTSSSTIRVIFQSRRKTSRREAGSDNP